MVADRAHGGRLAVALATFGTVCVLGGAGGILEPLVRDSHVGAAVIGFALFLAAAVMSSRFGGADEPVVRAVADVLAAGASFYLASAAGDLAVAGAGDDSSLPPVVAGLAALPYALSVQVRRPGAWTLIATSAALVLTALGAVHLVDGAPDQGYAAALVLVAMTLAVAAALEWLRPAMGLITVGVLVSLAAGAVLLGNDAGTADVLLAVLLLVLVTAVAATSRAPSVVGALAVGAPIVLGLTLAHTGHRWWSIPLAMAWAGAGCAVVAAIAARDTDGAKVGGVFTWCAMLVVAASLFLTSSNRWHAAVALVTSVALFGAAASMRRRPAAVLGALGVLAALPRVVANATAGRFLVLALGLGLIYLAVTAARRRA